MRVITSERDVAEGAAWLAAQDPRWAEALKEVGTVPLRLRPDGFSQLVSAIVSQQVSTASAAAIWARVEAAGLLDEEAVLACDDDQLRAVGLSRPKMRYVRALAAAGIDYVALRAARDDEVIEQLTAVTGIGVWTAEIYGMFSLGRADMFAAGDLALQVAAQALFELPDRPGEAALRRMAADWSPWRAVAARVLFAYYRVIKGREGVR